MSESLASKIECANAELLVEGNADAAEEFFTGDYVAHLTGSEMTGGPSAVRRFVGMLRRGFSDLDVEVDVLVESEDRVAWQRTVQGTHDGDFQGFPASGHRIVWRDMIVSRFEGDRIAEEWAVSDLVERLLAGRTEHAP